MARRKPKAADQLDQSENKTNPDDVEVIIDDENKTGEIDIEVEDTPHEDVDDTPDPLTVLKAKHDEHLAELTRVKREKADAEARARELEARAVSADKAARSAADVALDNALLVTKQNIERATSAIADAARRQDWEAYGQAQAALASSNASLHELEGRKRDLEAAPAPQSQPGSIEAYISSRTPETQRWLREHYDDIFYDQRKGQLAQAAHNFAVAKGIEPDSPSYFSFLDEQLGYKTVSENQNSQARTENKGKTAAPAVPAAPASRSQFGTPQARTPRQVRLTPEQRQYAEAMRPDLPQQKAWEAYAAGVAEIESGKSHLQWSRDRYK